MTQAISKLMTFDEFLEWKPENGRYELHNGVIVEIPNPTVNIQRVRVFRR